MPRRGMERLDLLLLAIEALDLHGSEAMVWSCEQLQLQEAFPDRVALWKSRCRNPLRRASRRGAPRRRGNASVRRRRGARP